MGVASGHMPATYLVGVASGHVTCHLFSGSGQWSHDLPPV